VDKDEFIIRSADTFVEEDSLVQQIRTCGRHWRGPAEDPALRPFRGGAILRSSCGGALGGTASLLWLR
jgi:hypothetical protein